MTESVMHSPAHVLEWDVADRMSKALRVSGVSVQAAADALGVNRGTVGRWLNGHTQPKRAALLAWASVTGVSVEWLENGETPAAGATGAAGVVRHQGLEPRTRWFTATGVALELVTEAAA